MSQRNQQQDEPLPAQDQKISRRLKLTLVASVALLGALVTLFLIGSYFFFIPFTEHTSQLNHSLEALKELGDMKQSAALAADSTEMKELEKRIERLQQEMLRVETYREKLMQETTVRAENIIRLAAFVVTSVSFFFGLFTLVIGWLSYRRYDELKRELEDRIKERYELKTEIEAQAEEQKRSLEEINEQSEEQRQLITQQKSDMLKWQEDFTSATATQQEKLDDVFWKSEALILDQSQKVTTKLQQIERRLNNKSKKLAQDIEEFNTQMEANNRLTVENRQYIRTLADEFYGYTIIEILNAFRESDIITSDAFEDLKTLMSEAQYLISLNDPDPEEQRRAIYGLYGLGTDKAIAKLKLVIETHDADSELYQLAEQAIAQIEKRQ